MKCPLCGSTDVECDENKAHHVHVCNACGHKDVFRVSVVGRHVDLDSVRRENEGKAI